MNAKVRAAISTIAEDAWTAIHYPHAFVDEEPRQLVSDAEVAEIEFTAFTSRRKSQQVTARLIVRRVKRLNPTSVPEGQDDLFSVYRFQVVFTDSPLVLIEALPVRRPVVGPGLRSPTPGARRTRRFTTITRELWGRLRLGVEVDPVVAVQRGQTADPLVRNIDNAQPRPRL